MKINFKTKNLQILLYQSLEIQLKQLLIQIFILKIKIRISLLQKIKKLFKFI